MPLGTLSQQRLQLLLARDPPRAAPAGVGAWGWWQLLPPSTAGRLPGSACQQLPAQLALLGAVPRGQQRPSQQCPPPQRLPHTWAPPTPPAKHPACGQDCVRESTLYWDAGSLPGPYALRGEGHETLCQPWPAGTGPASGHTGAQAASLPTSLPPGAGTLPAPLPGAGKLCPQIEPSGVPSCFL